MPPHRLAILAPRYPLPCTNHAHLYTLVAALLDDLKDTYDFSYVASSCSGAVSTTKTPLKLSGRYNTHNDLPRIEILLTDEVLHKTLTESIPVMVYRGTQNLDDPAYVFRPTQDAVSTMQDFIVALLKNKYGVTCKRSRWNTTTPATTPSINPALPSVTGNGTVGSGGVGGQVGSGTGTGTGSDTTPVVTPPVALVTDFNQLRFALLHSLPIGAAPDCGSGSGSGSGSDGTSGAEFGQNEIITNPGGEAEANLPNDDPAMNGAPKFYDAECVADVHESVIKFIDVLNWAAEAELVSLTPGLRFQVGTQYCAEDILSDLRAGLVQGGKFTVMFQPIWVAKKYDRHTLETLRAQVSVKLAATAPAPTGDVLAQLNAQMAAIDSTLAELVENEYLFLDMKDPSGDDRRSRCGNGGGVILPLSGYDDEDVTCIAPGSTRLTSCPSIEFPQMFSFAGCFEYSPEVNRFTIRVVKIYHTETDCLVQEKLCVLRDQICKVLMDNTSASIIGDNRSTSHFG